MAGTSLFPPPKPIQWLDSARGTITDIAWKWCYQVFLAAVPTGVVLPYAGSTAPSGFAFCNGDAVSRVENLSLFNVIGTTFGVGDGSTTFNLPDMRGRTGIGAGTGSGLTARTLGQTVGAEDVTLTTSQIPAHTHTMAHTHNISIDDGGGGGGTVRPAHTGVSSGSVTYATGGSSAANTGSSGTDGSHTNMQPSLVLNYIIKL